MARLRKMLKSFSFEDTYRKSMVLDQGVRLNPKKHRLELMPIGGPSGSLYPTTSNLHARTRVTLPEALKRWTGFFVVDKQTVNFSNQPTSKVGFKLNNGDDDYWFNVGAAAWVVAGAGNWNTEAEVAANISTYQFRALQVVVNLETSDKKKTPSVSEVRLSYEADLVFLEDYVVRSFIQDLREQLRPIGRVNYTSDGATLEIDLKKIETPYNIVGLDSVFDLTDDPNELSDLGASYDSVTKIVTLPAAVTTGNTIHVRFLWAPEVVISKSQDYTEISKIPVIVFEDATLLSRAPIRDRPYIIDKTTGHGFMFDDAFQADITIPFAFITDKGFDLHALADELKRYFGNNKLLRSRGQDEWFSLQVDDVFEAALTPSPSELHTGRLLVTVLRAVFYPQDAKSITGVKDFKVVGGQMNFATD